MKTRGRAFKMVAPQDLVCSTPRMQSKKRFSVCLDGPLLEELDVMVAAEGYKSRSQAMSAMINEQLVRHKAGFSSESLAGTITLVFDHHKHGLQARLTNIQHGYLEQIVASMHLHLTNHLCMEVLLVNGKAAQLRELTCKLTTIKGVVHGELSVTSATD